MTPEQVALVKSRLKEYRVYKRIAWNAGAESRGIQHKINECGTPSSPSWDGVPCQNHVGTDSRLNELITMQMEAIKMERHYRARMEAIQQFLRDNLIGDAYAIAHKHYICGNSYADMQIFFCRSTSGMRSLLERELSKLDFENAQTIL